MNCHPFVSICRDDAKELHDIALFFESTGKAENAAMLKDAANRYDALACAYASAMSLYPSALAFFGWFNCHYPEPSQHETHPWCRLGSLFSEIQKHNDRAGIVVLK